MKSMLRFSTFCRLCRDSLLWWAKEKEWRDSEGKRVRSSPEGREGDAGPAKLWREDLRDGPGES